MKTNCHSSQNIMVCLCLALWTLGTVRASDMANVSSHDIPAYARFEAGLIHTDGEWAAVPFYRPPGCVRPDFNLLAFFDLPAVFGCTALDPYLLGFAIWQDAPDGVPPLESGLPPSHIQLQLAAGQTMPIWFVRMEDLALAIADGVLTIGELAALPSLQVGAAEFYTETTHPLGGAKETMISVVASGTLRDGRTFDYTATETQGVLREVRIAFQ